MHTQMFRSLTAACRMHLATAMLLLALLAGLAAPAMAADVNLRAYWALDGGATDSSGYGNDGTLTGGSWSASHAPTGFANSGSLSLNGSSGQGIQAPLVTTATDNITLSAWVNWAGANGLDQMVLYNGNSGPNGYGIYITSTGDLSILNGGVAIASPATSFQLTAGVWQYVAVMRDAGVWKLFVDGTQIPLTGNPAPNVPSGGSTVGRAYAVSTNTFNGLIDDARIYDRVLAGTETCSPAITVTNANDSGAGSLRQAIAGSCAGGTITFNGNYTIFLASVLDMGKNLTIDGSGHTVTINGNLATRIFNLTGGTANINNLTIANGYFVDDNSGESGAGIRVTGGTLNLTNSTVAGNITGWPGGGGLELRSGTANVTNCAFIGNLGSYGGGIDTGSGTTLNVTNSTFSGNSANNRGGGLSISGVGTIINSTISGNSAVGGGGINNEGGSITVTNSIIANNPTGGNCINPYGSSYPFTGVNSLVDDASCSAGFTNSSSILLGTLGNYGGATETFPLLPGSSAIDAGDDATCAAAPVNSLDQRGVVRPQGTHCDIGAFESRGFTLAKTGGDSQSAMIGNSFAAPLTLTVTSSAGEPVNGGAVTFTAPSSGASTNPATNKATIATGAASKSVTANGTPGSYSVVASASGAADVLFALTNQDIPDLQITNGNNTSNTGYLGVSFNWVATVSNAGFGPATFTAGQTIVSDTLPASASYGTPTVGSFANITNSANISCGIAANVLTCTATGGSVIIGAGGSFTITYSAMPTAVATLTNVATVDPNNAITESNESNNTGSSTVTVTVPDLQITVSDGGISATPGGTVSYTLSYHNAGTAGATGVVITETVPIFTTFNAAASSAGWSCTPGNIAGNTCTYTIGTLAAGASGTVTYAVTVANPVLAGVTQIANTATIADDGTHGLDANPANNAGSDTTPIYTSAPTVTGVSPSAGPLSGNTTVTITGTGFNGAIAVRFGSSAASYTVDSDTQITAAAPAGSAGIVDITVISPGGTSATSAADRFTYLPAPTVTGISPAVGPTAGGTTVTITGTNFTTVVAVTFNGANAVSYTVNSDTQITATAPAGSGTVDITVITPGGASATSAADRFTYAPEPAVIMISPARGVTAGGTSVVITGAYFTGATAVKFGTTSATNFTVDSDTQITATAPAGSGTVDITVTTGSGTSASGAADQFTYVPALIYATAGGLTTGLCESWTNACELSYALANAATGQEIWTAAGTYKPTAGTDRTARFAMKSGVALYGGFNGTEMLRSQRNITANPTILSGDIGTSGDSSDNSYHVVIANNVDSSAILDGFTISGGNANGANPHNFGGGMFVFSASPTISNCTFSGNAAVEGGGIFSYLGTPAIANTTFTGNTATYAGGMFIQDSIATITNSSFTGNRSTGGAAGAIYIYSSDVTSANVTISGTTFADNISDDGNGIGTGGALQTANGTVTLTNSTFNGNRAEGYNDDGGGAVMVYGGTISLTNCTLSGNSTASTTGGGGISTRQSDPQIGISVTLTNTIVAGNASTAVTPDLSGSFSTGGYNFIGTGDGSTGLTDGAANDRVGTNAAPLLPLLGALGSYGGPTRTIPLLPGSLAIDAGNPAVCANAAVNNLDQRGKPRQAGKCAIGAFEPQGFTLSTSTGDNQSAVIDSGFVTPLAVILSETGGSPLQGATVTFAGPGSGASANLSSPAATGIDGSTGVTATANGSAGSYSVTASAIGATSVAFNLTNLKGNQSITFGSAPVVIVGGTGTVNATATSGLTVSFTSTTPAICSVSGATVTGLAAGDCTIAGDQPGNANNNAAAQVSQSFAIGKGSQTITFGTAPTVYVGTIGTLSATATSGLTVSFTSTTPSICTVSGTTVTGVAAGTCTIVADQAGNSNYTAASQATQDIPVTVSISLSVSALADGSITTETTQNVSGTVTNPTYLSSLTINGTAVTVTPAGSFSYPVQLIAGANTITVVATSTVGDVLTDSRTITLNTTAPHLTISTPADNTSVIQQSITVTGTVTPATATTVTCAVNGGTPQIASISGGDFTCTPNLTLGMNTIVITATDGSHSAQAKRTITYAPTFTLAITDPASDVRTVKSSYTLTGSIADNTTPVTVTITVDGQTYSPTVASDGTFSQALTFTEGKVYQATVTGTDQNGTTVNVQRNIIYSTPTVTPFTIEDALKALQMAVGVIPPQADLVQRLDVAPMVNGVSTGDGIIDVEDAIVILRIVVGLI